MSAKPPETFNLDRLQTPIGTALLVTDSGGVLRALDWEEHEPRMKDLLRLQYGAWSWKDARSPGDFRSALTAYFTGDLDRLNTIKWRVAGTPFQRRSGRLCRHPRRHDAELRRARRETRPAQGDARRRPANGSNPISVVVPCHRVIGANGSLAMAAGWSASAGCWSMRGWR